MCISSCPSKNKLAQRNWQQDSFASALGLPVLCSHAWRIEQLFLSTNQLLPEFMQRLASLARSRKHLVMNPLARLLLRLQVPKGLSPGLNRMREWDPKDFTFWPWFCQSPGFVLRAPVTAPMPGVIRSHPQVRSWLAFRILSSLLCHTSPTRTALLTYTKEKTQIISGRCKGQHLSNPGPCYSANRPAHCTKSLEALCLRAHGG